MSQDSNVETSCSLHSLFVRSSYFLKKKNLHRNRLSTTNWLEEIRNCNEGRKCLAKLCTAMPIFWQFNEILLNISFLSCLQVWGLGLPLSIPRSIYREVKHSIDSYNSMLSDLLGAIPLGQGNRTALKSQNHKVQPLSCNTNQ